MLDTSQSLAPPYASAASARMLLLGYCGDPMTRYVIDAPTLLHLVDQQLAVDADHRLVAPHAIRSDALQLLLDEVRRGARTEVGPGNAHPDHRGEDAAARRPGVARDGLPARA